MEPEDAFRKRARVSGAVSGSSAGGPDLLSSLPDCLLHTIMSFLKARQVVQTCVLSTRWRHLWCTVPCLDVDFDEFNTVPVSDNSDSDGDDNSGSGGEENSDSEGNDNSDSSNDDGSRSDSDASDSESDGWHVRPDNNHRDWKDFEYFALTLMRRCNIAQLESLQLHIDRIRAPVFGSRVAGWLCHAMKYCTPDHAIQHGLSSGSWSLKMLHLSHVFLNDNFLNCVNSVCCSLEDLVLDNCTCQIQSITSHSLKTLVLKRCLCYKLSEIISPTLKKLVIDGSSNTGFCELAILAHSVAYLKLAMHVDHFRGGVSLNKVPAIAKALIILWGHKCSFAGGRLNGDQFKLLCSISNSTNLELSGIGLTLLGKEPRFQKFKNLRYLVLDNCDLSDDFKTLVFFLRSSPILEKLTLRLCAFPEYSNKKKGTPILNKTSASELHGLDLLCENLKVEIIYDHGSGQRLIRVLQRVSVNLSKNNIKLVRINYLV